MSEQSQEGAAGAPSLPEPGASPAYQPDNQGEDTGAAPDEQQHDLDSGDSEGEGGGENPKPRGGFQRRISELTSQRRALERQNQQLMEILDRTTGQASRQAEPEAQQEAPDDAEPNPSEYYGGMFDPHFIKDTAAWQTRQALAEQAQVFRARQEQAQAQAGLERVRADFGKRCEAFTASKPDFAEVAFDPEVPMPERLALVIATSERGPEIAYYLGSNRAEAAKIAGLPPVLQAKAIGQLEARIEAGSVQLGRATTRAPQPPSTLRGANGAFTKNPEKMSVAEYRQWRQSGGGS